MSGQLHDHFDLTQFVLGYLEEQGSIVAPADFGIFDVLLPDELAAQLALDGYQRISFSAPGAPGATSQPALPADVLQLGVNHPLVETMAAAAAAKPAHARAYINAVRIDKQGLPDLVRKQFVLPNARVDTAPKAFPQAELHHYLLFNFKVALVSEEKQEELATVVMDVQAGCAVRDPALLTRLEVLDTEPGHEGLDAAASRWGESGLPLGAETFAALLPRAEAALRQDLLPQLAILAARAERHLALDQARIEAYYGELATDLARRRTRAGVDEAQLQSLGQKLAALDAERAAKLADMRARYGVRAEAALANLLLVAQPKITLPIIISNRTTTISRTAIWDPLLHRLEPLVCDACGQPGEGLHLCHGGHLAHAGCLSPQCVDCKRVFCHLCADQVTTCAVCRRPVCRPSLIRCPICGRGTCRADQGLCHAADGQPVELPKPVAPVPAPAPAGKQPPAKPPPAAQITPPSKAPRPLAAGKAKAKPAAPATSEPLTKGVRIDVEIHELEPRITAFVMRSTKGVLATRSYVLTPHGIACNCQCEKKNCPADGYYHRPLPASGIMTQISKLLLRLQQEYLVPAKKVHYYYIYGQSVTEKDVLILPAAWFDPVRLAEAYNGFDKLFNVDRPANLPHKPKGKQ